MSFHANRLSGTIPTEVGFLASLGIVETAFAIAIASSLTFIENNSEMLDFARVGLSGTIPSEIGLCRNLSTYQLFLFTVLFCRVVDPCC